MNESSRNSYSPSVNNKRSKEKKFFSIERERPVFFGPQREMDLFEDSDCESKSRRSRLFSFSTTEDANMETEEEKARNEHLDQKLSNEDTKENEVPFVIIALTSQLN